MEMVEIIKEYIKPELFILIPVLYLIGLGIKKTSLKNEVIPFVLGIVAVFLSALYIFATGDMHTAKDIAMAIFMAITQGILISGASVYFNQLYKQAKKF